MIKRSNSSLLEQIQFERKRVKELATLFEDQETQIRVLKDRVFQLEKQNDYLTIQNQVLRENIRPKQAKDRLRLPLQKLQQPNTVAQAELKSSSHGVCEFQKIKQEIETMRQTQTKQFDQIFAQFSTALTKTKQLREQQ